MILVCVQCEEEFEFSAMEQAKCEERDMTYPNGVPRAENISIET